MPVTPVGCSLVSAPPRIEDLFLFYWFTFRVCIGLSSEGDGIKRGTATLTDCPRGSNVFSNAQKLLLQLAHSGALGPGTQTEFGVYTGFIKPLKKGKGTGAEDKKPKNHVDQYLVLKAIDAFQSYIMVCDCNNNFNLCFSSTLSNSRFTR